MQKTIQQLFPRQQPMARISWVIGISVVIIIGFIVSGHGSIQKWETKVAVKQQENARIQQLAKQLQTAKQSVTTTDRSIRIVTLLPWLEKTIAKQELKTQLVQIKPIEAGSKQAYRESAALLLQDMSMAKAVEFIDSLEGNREIRIIKANLKRMPNADKQGVTLSLEVGLI